MDPKLAMLAKVPLFAGMGQRELESVGQLCDEVDLPAGRTLTREGESGNEFFVIVDGSVAVTRGGATVATLGPGDFLGEIALVDHGPRTATTTTTTPTRVMVMGVREFHSLLDGSPAIQSTVLQALAARVRRLDPTAS